MDAKIMAFLVIAVALTIGCGSKSEEAKPAQTSDKETVMKYTVTEAKGTVSIEVPGIASEDQKNKLLGSFKGCQSGNCTCPTDEFRNLQDMQIREDKPGHISLILKPKGGTAFDLDEIRRCLDAVVAE